MSLETALIEVRRNLRCANVFLTFAEPLAEAEGSVKIILKRNEILVRSNDDMRQTKEIKLGSYFSLETHTLSCLVVRGNSASFRISLCDETGSLEFLNTIETEQNTRINLKTNLDINEKCQISCSNCESRLLSESKVFERVLELPSGSVDVGDWFCHKSSSFETNLKPKINDIFYGLYFILLDIRNLVGVRIKDNHLYCKRCLKLLGESIFGESAAKLWNDNFKIAKNDEGDAINFFRVENNKKCIYSIINKTLYECNLTPEIHFIQFAKILFVSVCPARKRNFLMFNIMEKNLELLKFINFNSTSGYDEDDEDEDVNESNQNEENVLVEELESFKVLYRVEEDGDQPLLNFWKNDLNVNSVEISYRMFTELVKTLIDNSLLVPEAYRHSNGFILSYFYC